MKLFTEPNVAKLEKIADNEILDGYTILHHTGNMFGIGCLASDLAAINKINKLKLRESKAGFIMLVPDIEWFDDLEITIPDRLKPIIEQYWPGNLTVIIKCNDPRFEHLAHNGKLAFRVPSDDMLRYFIDYLDEPLISTSINVSTLAAENDLNKITKQFEHWFDIGIVPKPRRLSNVGEPSTIIEYIESHEPGNHSGQDKLKCLREGSIPFYELNRSFDLPLVMFVCTANICRSPIAEYLFNHLIKKTNLRYIADSSGLMEGGSMISLNSLKLLMEHGISEAQVHISQNITPELASNSWLILTMEERQRNHLKNLMPEAAHKLFTINEIVGEDGDVKDPFGSDIENYRVTYDLIEDRLHKLIAKIQNKSLGFTAKKVNE
ncbi:MAG: protein tyrosine phosphatase [Candidatus Cloacimonetes bacterium HGW-Cloacimonetes-1]|jgi:tRNA threonylcarbamoyl adenosine modification protein (Sua5/YciO/YrdC/YwlC family)|nr:MAG: protein tyrosine phosphatase [Candidatus Cloacimonetes bacterium HGW-Cloacimonetes-1]